MAAAFFSAATAQTSTPTSLVRPLAGAEVDWSAGTVTASAGAAADMRMPSADAARPGAERRARAVAMEKLRAALRALPLRRNEKLSENEIEAALGRANTARVEYQSNGGVVLWMQVRFEDLTGSTASTTKVVLVVGAMALEAGPVVVAEGKEVVVRNVRYRQGTAPADAISVRRDERGRLLLPKGAEVTLARLAGAQVVIYLQKVAP